MSHRWCVCDRLHRTRNRPPHPAAHRWPKHARRPYRQGSDRRHHGAARRLQAAHLRCRPCPVRCGSRCRHRSGSRPRRNSSCHRHSSPAGTARRCPCQRAGSRVRRPRDSGPRTRCPPHRNRPVPARHIRRIAADAQTRRRSRYRRAMPFPPRSCRRPSARRRPGGASADKASSRRACRRHRLRACSGSLSC